MPNAPAVPNADAPCAERGAFRPIVDFMRCDGEAKCQRICPVDVFEVRRLDDLDDASLPFWIALRADDRPLRTAYTPRAERCDGCGACVDACPSKAIILVVA